ncbi:hypothetical protein E4U28_002561 [Claviceps purpurea]|nr:hypothetical protein E4U28_002561 [Claviceps purpurea]
MYLSVAQQRPPHHPAKIKQEEDPGWKRSVAVLLPRFLSVAQGALFAKAHDERPIYGNDVTVAALVEKERCVAGRAWLDDASFIGSKSQWGPGQESWRPRKRPDNEIQRKQVRGVLKSETRPQTSYPRYTYNAIVCRLTRLLQHITHFSLKP